MNESSIEKAYDVVIVGARVAGTATAMLLATLGFRVLVFDKSRFGSDTLSTHALMRPAVLLLKRWGITDRLDAEGTPRIRNTTFIYSDAHGTETIPIEIKSRHGVDALYAPRRTVLDRVMAEAAADAGATVRHGVTLTNLLHDRSGRVSGVRVVDELGQVKEVQANLVIGADGRRSTVARLVSAIPYVWGRHATSSAFGYFDGLPVDGNRWYYRPGFGCGAIPTNDGQTCLFVATPNRLEATSPSERLREFERAVELSAPDIAAYLPEAKLTGRLRLFPGMRGFLRQPWGEGWALVGDAGYMSDPISAHGITNALRDADILSRTIAEGASLAEYQTTRDDLSLRFFELSDRVASYDWDIPTLKQYHRIMSQEMGREEESIVAASDRPSLRSVACG
jgi:flavin-dependent dehydrogenase